MFLLNKKRDNNTSNKKTKTLIHAFTLSLVEINPFIVQGSVNITQNILFFIHNRPHLNNPYLNVIQ